MLKQPPAADPDAYVAALRGWRRELVTSLRAAVRSAAAFDEVVKWGHLVYSSHGPVLLIRAEPSRVLFGFWRGQRLAGIEPRLEAGGKYEMATLALREGDTLAPAVARRLAREAAALNRRLGDPTLAAKRPAGRRPAGKRAEAGRSRAKSPSAKRSGAGSGAPRPGRRARS